MQIGKHDITYDVWIKRWKCYNCGKTWDMLTTMPIKERYVCEKEEEEQKEDS